MLRAVKVTFVQDDHRRDIVHLACHQKSVQERELDLRKIQGDNGSYRPAGSAVNFRLAKSSLIASSINFSGIIQYANVFCKYSH